MNALNRLVLIVLALLLIIIPVGLGLVALGVIPADTVNTYTGYRSGLDALGGLTVDAFSMTARVIIGIASGLLALLALILLLRELTFGKRVEQRATIVNEPGNETVMTARAVRHLAEGASLESGAVSPKASLESKKGAYNVACNIEVPERRGLSETATRVRENIQRVLEDQQVPFRNVEVTVRGADQSNSGSRR